MTQQTTPPLSAGQLRAQRAQLEAQLATIAAEEAAELDARRARLKDAQDAHDRRVLAQWRNLDAELEAQGTATIKEAKAAAQTGDLTAAFDGYVDWHAARNLRQSLRMTANNAHRRQTGLEDDLAPELRFVEFTFAKWLEEQGAAASWTRAEDRLVAEFDAFPLTLEDLDQLEAGQQ